MSLIANAKKQEDITLAKDEKRVLADIQMMESIGIYTKKEADALRKKLNPPDHFSTLTKYMTPQEKYEYLQTF